MIDDSELYDTQIKIDKEYRKELTIITEAARKAGCNQQTIVNVRKKLHAKYYALQQEAKDEHRLNVFIKKNKLVRPQRKEGPVFKRVPTFRLDDEECYENNLVHFGMACEVLPSNNPMQMQFKL